MLLAGSDVSGDEQTRNEHKHVGFIIGREEDINTQYNRIGLNKTIHMRHLKPQERDKIRNSLDFAQHNILAWCFHLEKINVVNYIFKHELLHPKTRSKKSVFEYFDRFWLDVIKERLEELCYNNRINLQQINVQCEGDMFPTVQNWKMQTLSRGRAYEMTDAIAWFNERNCRVNGCIDLDLRDPIRQRMEAALLKK